MIVHIGPGDVFAGPTPNGPFTYIGRTVCGTCGDRGYLRNPLRMCPYRCPPNLAQLTAIAQLPELYAEAEAAWVAAELACTDPGPPPTVVVVAHVLHIDPEMLWDHVEAIHGWEPHDEDYEEAVWAAADCTDPAHRKLAEIRAGHDDQP